MLLTGYKVSDTVRRGNYRSQFLFYIFINIKKPEAIIFQHPVNQSHRNFQK